MLIIPELAAPEELAVRSELASTMRRPRFPYALICFVRELSIIAAIKRMAATIGMSDEYSDGDRLSVGVEFLLPHREGTTDASDHVAETCRGVPNFLS